MCIVFGACAHLCSAVVGPSELFHQSSLAVASVAELEAVESGPEMQTWVRSRGMQRPESQEVLELPTFCELQALKLLVAYCFGGPGRQKVLESSMLLEVKAAKIFVL